MGYHTIIAQYVAKWGIAQTCLCETKYQGGGIAPFWGSANLLEKVSRDMGYRSDSIAISRDMGPLSVNSGRCFLRKSENLEKAVAVPNSFPNVFPKTSMIVQNSSWISGVVKCYACEDLGIFRE